MITVTLKDLTQVSINESYITQLNSGPDGGCSIFDRDPGGFHYRVKESREEVLALIDAEKTRWLQRPAASTSDETAEKRDCALAALQNLVREFAQKLLSERSSLSPDSAQWLSDIFTTIANLLQDVRSLS
jgi:hypothetical protein